MLNYKVTAGASRGTSSKYSGPETNGRCDEVITEWKPRLVLTEEKGRSFPGKLLKVMWKFTVIPDWLRGVNQWNCQWPSNKTYYCILIAFNSSDRFLVLRKMNTASFSVLPTGSYSRYEPVLDTLWIVKCELKINFFDKITKQHLVA